MFYSHLALHSFSQILSLGEPIVTVSAKDGDRIAPHNATRYSLRSDQSSARFFMIDEVTGVISLKQSLLDGTDERYEVLGCVG